MAVLKIEDVNLRAEIESLKEEVAVATRGLVKFGLVQGIVLAAGRCSARIPNSSWFICKGRGYKVDSLSKMSAEDMVIYDLDCNILEAHPGIDTLYEIESDAEALAKALGDSWEVIHKWHEAFTVGYHIGQKCLKYYQRFSDFLKRRTAIYREATKDYILSS